MAAPGPQVNGAPNDQPNPPNDVNEEPMEEPGEETESEESEEHDDTLDVESRTGIVYDLAALEPDTARRAFVGLTGDHRVDTFSADEGGYDFRVSDRARVHLEDDRYTCSCSAFQHSPNFSCNHIYVSPVPCPSAHCGEIHTDYPSSSLTSSTPPSPNPVSRMCPCPTTYARRKIHASN